MNIALTGSTNSIISMLLYFYIWQPVYFKHGESTDFPFESKESCSHFVGLAKHVGHVMIIKVLAGSSSILPSPLNLGSRTRKLILLVGNHLLL